MPLAVAGICLLIAAIAGAGASAADTDSPESALRALVRSNAEKNMAGLARHMAQDVDVIGYTIGGRKYVGWADFAAEMEHEFRSVSRLEIPINQLKVWTRGDVAWFAMELDYIRHLPDRPGPMRLALRETGVLEKRNGTWMLVAWHESSRTGAPNGLTMDAAPATLVSEPASGTIDVSGQWEIHEEDRSYMATLDQHGNGTYTYQGGRITTSAIANRLWSGTWHQPGNDREGGFEVLLSEDGNEARGVWWYTRVDTRTNIPPRQWGGSYVWKRVRSDRSVQ